ncbi:hypothetical protein BLI708_06695 [Bifidobacterium imperatoris]|uniref:Uncharacterized protein n=1 Tax=Bifidobacterium imperatoris TaxID=2020965 RepID=A0A2N5IQV0_9BIFI|nr:hypothetical protein [Bifidobacterium imperatoris]PLS24336.1 hypothetical protein Tam1G_1599 [Bifidobacterium imperatoris]QSY56960.1 hypothetical protein BLI708_06695 [Bifidobacterium imperatoris]
MQKPYMFIDWGEGWTGLNDPQQDIAAFSTFSIEWGVQNIDSQPDPSVMTFTIRDRKGWLTGHAITLAGARLLVQITEQPTWNMLTTDMGAWGAQKNPLSRLHSAYSPSIPGTPDNTAITLFDGIIGNGGTATAYRDGWKLKLSASGRLLLWKRLASQGPTSTDTRWNEQHWVNTTTADRLNELNRRAIEAGAPSADATGLETTGTPASYGVDEYPTQLDLLHRLYAHHPELPLWYEVPHKDASRVEYTPLNSPVTIGVTVEGVMTVNETPAISAKLVETDDEQGLTIPEPVTQLVIKGKKATADDKGVLGFEEAEATLTDQNRLPANLTATQSSITLESDMTLQDDSGGVFTRAGGATWKPSDTDRQQTAIWIETKDRRLTPDTIVFDGRRIDPAEHPELYLTSPPGPLIFQGMRSGQLTDESNRPATGGAYTAIGGTLTFDWQDSTPVLRNEVTLWPLPLVQTDSSTWADLKAWPATWAETVMSLAELGLIHDFEQPKPLDQPNWEGQQQ